MAKKTVKKSTAKKSAKKAVKKKATKKATVKHHTTVHRFAHPFYTDTKPKDRKEVPGAGKRMTDYVATKLEKIPEPLREPTMTLEEIIGKDGVTGIQQFKSISFHAVGDTGEPKGDSQQMVADAMSEDYNASHPHSSPAFFLHLGDVNYYENNDKGYHAQFYEPYKKYPGKIIAIPGNHDGELFKYDGSSVGQKKSLAAFMQNFCLPKPSVPPAAGSIYRQMVSQPGVYWVLNAPFVDVIGLYSNIAEGPGYISGKAIGTKQKDWFTKTLTQIKKARVNGGRKALIIAVHHPPFSNGGHDASTDMLKDIDDSCHTAGIMPDALLAGHAHSYQRYTRNINFGGKDLQIPFVVCGCGGRTAQSVKKADGSTNGDHTYDASFRGYGYLSVMVSESNLTIEFLNVVSDKKSSYDKVQVNLHTNSIS